MLELSEPINVWTYFQGSSIKPLYFSWKGRQIKVEKINLVHTTLNGSSNVYHFSISSGGNFYKLAFDLKSLKWWLEAVEEG